MKKLYRVLYYRDDEPMKPEDKMFMEACLMDGQPIPRHARTLGKVWAEDEHAAKEAMMPESAR